MMIRSFQGSPGNAGRRQIDIQSPFEKMIGQIVAGAFLGHRRGPLGSQMGGEFRIFVGQGGFLVGITDANARTEIAPGSLALKTRHSTLHIGMTDSRSDGIAQGSTEGTPTNGTPHQPMVQQSEEKKGPSQRHREGVTAQQGGHFFQQPVPSFAEGLGIEFRPKGHEGWIIRAVKMKKGRTGQSGPI